MAVIRPFKCVRPAKEMASSIAALPYDVYTREEAREIVKKNPLSFLKIDRAETQFPPNQDMYSQAVYDKARETLQKMLAQGDFVRDEAPCYYLYALTMEGHTQTGLVGCASIDDYEENRIKKHENTRRDKELDRTRHVDTLSAQTGPIFLAYQPHARLEAIVASVKTSAPLYDFTSEDLVRHQVWKIDGRENIEEILRIFQEIDSIYIADGHHRAASAVKAGQNRRLSHPEFTGEEEFNYFLSVLFPASELHIYAYNRVVSDLNGYTFGEFLDILGKSFEIKILKNKVCRPDKKGDIGLYGNGSWYKLTAKPPLLLEDPVGRLDVSILQDAILDPVLGIKDPKTDPRLRFIGGIRGLGTLAQEVGKAGGGAAFAMYPTAMEELLSVAGAGLLMPPKSTWFEPKLRSGLFIHEFEK